MIMFFTIFSEENFKDLKETLLFQIENYERQYGLFTELGYGFAERLSLDTDNVLTNAINEFNEINDMGNHQSFHHQYNNETIEETMIAWYRLTMSYREEAGEFSKELYKYLSKIKCENVLGSKIIRIGKIVFYKHVLTTFSEEDFKDIKETLLLHIDHFESESGLFGELWNKLMERLSPDTDNVLTDSKNDIDQEE